MLPNLTFDGCLFGRQSIDSRLNREAFGTRINTVGRSHFRRLKRSEILRASMVVAAIGPTGCVCPFVGFGDGLLLQCSPLFCEFKLDRCKPGF